MRPLVASLAGRGVMAQQQLAKHLAHEGRTLCLYHYPCPDGIFSALAVHLYHRARGKPVSFVPNRVFAPETVDGLQLQGDEVVYMVDFAGPRGFAKEVAAAAKRCVVLDHHKTSAAELTDPAIAGVDKLEVHFDMGRSGATVALDYFEPQGLTLEQQQLFKYIEDADLWRWALTDSKAFHSGLASLQLEFDATKNPAIFEQLLALTPEAVIARGKPILKEEERKIAAIVAEAFTVNLGGALGAERGWGQCLAVTGEEAGKLRSQVGNAVAEKAKSLGLRAVAVVAYTEEAMGDATKLKVSLRSIGEEDTTVVSEAYGGGGHKNASSFILDAAEFEAWKA